MATLPPPMSYEIPSITMESDARLRTIWLSIIAAFLFNMLPWHDLQGVPDLVALAVLFWSIHQPHRFSVGSAFCAGLLLDAANGVLLGQHALACSALAFAGNELSRRVLGFGLRAQAFHVVVLLLLAQALMLAVRIAMGGTFPGVAWFASSLIATLFWPLASFAHRFGRQVGRSADPSN